MAPTSILPPNMYQGNAQMGGFPQYGQFPDQCHYGNQQMYPSPQTMPYQEAPPNNSQPPSFYSPPGGAFMPPNSRPPPPAYAHAMSHAASHNFLQQQHQQEQRYYNTLPARHKMSDPRFQGPPPGVPGYYAQGPAAQADMHELYQHVNAPMSNAQRPLGPSHFAPPTHGGGGPNMGYQTTLHTQRFASASSPPAERPDAQFTPQHQNQMSSPHSGGQTMSPGGAQIQPPMGSMHSAHNAPPVVVGRRLAPYACHGPPLVKNTMYHELLTPS